MFSDRWLHVSDLRPSLRARLRVTPRRIRGEAWFLLHDPLTNEHTRLSAEAWAFLARLAPGRSVGEAWNDAYLAGDAAVMTQARVIDLITSLFRRNLLTLSAPTDSARLAERGRKAKRKSPLQRAQSLLFMTVPLVDPDRALCRFMPLIRPLLGPMGLLLWLLVFLAGLSVLASQWGRVTDASAAVFAAPDPLGLFLAFLLGKALHELGHAVACRHFGGPVHTMGVMLLIFAPLPYVDVSSAWAFRSRAQRVAVGAAGMAVDVFIAALATLIWSETPPGAFNDAAFSLMLTSATYTVFFNANPLMRFDGYYILSDLLEVPNLAIRASGALQRAFTQLLFGAPRGIEEEGLHAGLVAFGAATLAYRIFASVGIAIFLADQYYGAGLVAAIVLAVAAGGLPLSRLIKQLRQAAGQGQGSPLRRWWLGGGAALLLLLIALLPLPNWTTLPTSIEAIGTTQVTAATEGWLDEFLATPNTVQRRGAALMRLTDPQLLLERRGIEQQLVGNALLERRALTEGGANLEPIRERRRSLEALLAQIDTDLAALTIRAPRDGIWAAEALEPRLRGWVDRGTELGLLIPDEGYRMVAMVSQAASAHLAQHAGSAATLRCGGTAGTRLAVTDLRLVPYAVGRLPNAALGTAMGGEVAVSGHDASGTSSAEPVFRLEGIIMAAGADWLYHRRTCTARVPLPARSLGARWIESLRQFIQRRYRL